MTRRVRMTTSGSSLDILCGMKIVHNNNHLLKSQLSMALSSWCVADGSSSSGWWWPLSRRQAWSFREPRSSWQAALVVACTGEDCKKRNGDNNSQEEDKTERQLWRALDVDDSDPPKLQADKQAPPPRCAKRSCHGVV